MFTSSSISQATLKSIPKTIKNGYLNVSKTVQKGKFRSGIAARLAGVPVETLRVWERRYAITPKSVEPGAHRLYDQDDIDRLTLLKRLVDLGQSIGTIAQLDKAGLQSVQASLMNLSQSGRGSRVPHPDRIALIGSVLGSEMLKEALDSVNLRVEAQATSLSQLNVNGPVIGLDALFVEVPTLLDNTAEEIQRQAESIGIQKLVFLYRFAPNTLIRKLRSRGYYVVRMPSDIHEIVMLCVALLQRDPIREERPANAVVSEGYSAPKFSIEALTRLSQVKSGVYCECPSQLADLLISITAFEQYSAQCASQTPEDAALHKRLGSDAARARQLLEASISEVIRHERISI